MTKQNPDPDIGSLETEMNRGFIHILVLALLEKDMYGYSMVKHIETLGYRVEENTLYPLLRRLEKNGWIASKWDLSEDRPRKFYAVTPAGRAIRASLLDIWKTQDRILERLTGLNIEKLVQVARQNETILLYPDALTRIKKCRRMLENKIKAREIMYGVNTGIGEFSEIVLNNEQMKDFQKYLNYNHAAGIGEPAPLEYVRGAMLARVNVHAHGNSGCRQEITQTLVEMINKGVTQYVCQKGSVGACGDLAPMAQIALLMMGEGKAFYQGKLLGGREVLEKALRSGAGVDSSRRWSPTRSRCRAAR